MSESYSLDLHRSKRIKLGLLVSLSIVLFSTVVSSQIRSPKGSRQRPAAKASIDYSRFSHTTKKHQAKCDTCHQVPTKGWQRISDFPDIADYPDHVACVGCHKPQFFRSASPVICSVCHRKVGPRADDRFNFRDTRLTSQFAIEFPHDKHQNVIAANERADRSVFRHISFQEDTKDIYNNCTICHSPRKALPNAHWPDGYVPDLLTFKTSPVSHASCFNCHWKSQAPVRDSCEGCHKLITTFTTTASLSRISLKFRHDGGGEKRNHVAECTTCHINITKSASVRGLRPDVPITSCSECHNKDGLRLDVSTELAKLDKNRDFVCVYCHTSDVGKRNPPSSHYLIAEREPLTLRNSK